MAGPIVLNRGDFAQMNWWESPQAAQALLGNAQAMRLKNLQNPGLLEQQKQQNRLLKAKADATEALSAIPLDKRPMTPYQNALVEQMKFNQQMKRLEQEREEEKLRDSRLPIDEIVIEEGTEDLPTEEGPMLADRETTILESDYPMLASMEVPPVDLNEKAPAKKSKSVQGIRSFPVYDQENKLIGHQVPTDRKGGSQFVKSTAAGGAGAVFDSFEDARTSAPPGFAPKGKHRGNQFILETYVPLTGNRGQSLNEIYEGVSDVDRRAIQDLVARKHGMGAKSAEYAAPYVEGLRAGKTIEEMERESTQSSIPSLSKNPAYFDAFRSISSGLKDDQVNRFQRDLNAALSEGKIEAAQQLLTRYVKEGMGTEEKAKISGREKAIKLMEDMRENLQEFGRNGGDTGLFNGTIEQVANKFGAVVDPKLRAIAQEIKTQVQAYRQAISGAAFTAPEDAEYKSMFPSISNTEDLNMAIIDGFSNAMGLSIAKEYAIAMGEDAFKQIFLQPEAKAGAEGSPEQVLTEKYKAMLDKAGDLNSPEAQRIKQEFQRELLKLRKPTSAAAPRAPMPDLASMAA